LYSSLNITRVIKLDRMTCSIQERNENFVNKLGRIHEGKIFGKTEKIILKLILNLIWGV